MLMVEIHCAEACNKTTGAFDVKIEFPQVDPGSGDFFCAVFCDAINLRMNVFGVTRRQAIRTALEMVAVRVGSVLSEELDDVD